MHEKRQQEVDLQSELDLITAYRSAVYIRMAFTKKGLPPFETELMKLKKGSDELSPEASAGAIRSWLGRNKQIDVN